MEMAENGEMEEIPLKRSRQCASDHHVDVHLTEALKKIWIARKSAALFEAGLTRAIKSRRFLDAVCRDINEAREPKPKKQKTDIEQDNSEKKVSKV